jgi:5'-3' exonuclease
MGIPSYFSYIVKNHTAIIKKILPANQINNFYLDCNSIIYDCIHKPDAPFTTTETLINNVCVKIEEYVKDIRPNNILYITFDGVAPIAKLDQQRGRRYKSTYNVKSDTDSDKQADETEIQTIESFNTSQITPGTQFMKQLNLSVKKYFENKATSYKVAKIILSMSDEPGEGEHKIFDYIRKNPEQHTEDTSTVVYGLDADLIMLSINHLPVCENIFLYRETPEFVKSINIELEANKRYLLDINLLSKEIVSTLSNGVELTPKQQANCIYDYVFICFLLGNDFMPHFPSINIRTNGITKIMDAYYQAVGSEKDVNLTNGKVIYWKNVKKMLYVLAEKEEDYYKEEVRIRKRQQRFVANVDANDKLLYASDKHSLELETYIDVNIDGWQDRYYQTLFNIDIDKVRRKQICMNFLEGLEWTMKYYTFGCPNWDWRYRYTYPPLLIDLINYIPYFENELITNKPPNPVDELVQLMYVLPKKNLYLLPDKIHGYLLLNHREWYTEDCKFISAYCKYNWESHAELPEIDINELIKIAKRFRYAK